MSMTKNRTRIVQESFEFLKRLRGFSLNLLWILGLLFIFSCEKSMDTTKKTESSRSNHLVSLEKAKRMALNFEVPNKDTEKRTLKSTNAVSSVEIVTDSASVPVFYGVNMVNNSFVLISADDRALPVLGYSDEGNFEMDTAENAGLKMWVDGTKEYIKRVREGSVVESDTAAFRRWMADLDPSEPFEPTYYQTGYGNNNYLDTGDTCTIYYTRRIGPLLRTAWNQLCGYNSCCPPNTGGPCNFCVTGCCAVAMAQIMRYHQWPSNYNWSNMPNTQGNLDIAQLMRHIGDATNTTYGAQASSTDTRQYARNAFVNTFGYSSSATYIDYNTYAVINELRNARPVLMRGSVTNYVLGIPYCGNGHVWVCDGFEEWFAGCTRTTYAHLHMNWGWGGIDNGYFLCGSFNGYGCDPGCIIGIRKP